MRKLSLALLPVVIVLSLAVSPAAAKTARVRLSTPAWAPAATAAIHPGVETFTGGAQCTANFVFTNGTTVYIGQAAHCSGTGGNTATNGCTSGTLPPGTAVTVNGAQNPGTMVYNSWWTMQNVTHETDANTCQFNDLALVQLSAADAANTNPSVPFWGGPTGLTTGTSLGDEVFSYGNSELRLGLSELSPKVGVSLGTGSGGWSTSVYTVTPGIPGDSGSAFMNSSGQALGILSTVELAPLPASNGVGTLSLELDYAHNHFGVVDLALGTQGFTGLPVASRATAKHSGSRLRLF